MTSLEQLRTDRRKARINAAVGEPTYQETTLITRKHRHQRFAGVGSALKFLIKDRHGASACGSCVQLAQEMDEKGPDWVRENMEYCARKMHENVEDLRKTKQGNWTTFAEYLAYPLSGLYFHKRLIYDAVNLFESTLAVASQSSVISSPVAGLLGEATTPGLE